MAHAQPPRRPDGDDSARMVALAGRIDEAVEALLAVLYPEAVDDGPHLIDDLREPA